jgi:hypothetical protein
MEPTAAEEDFTREDANRNTNRIFCVTKRGIAHVGDILRSESAVSPARGFVASDAGEHAHTPGNLGG